MEVQNPTCRQLTKKDQKTIDKFQNKSKKSIKEMIKFFFFPLMHVKVFRSVSLIVILAALIALGLILSFVHINIPGFGISIGFSNLASLIIGWFFGPIYGLFMGMVIDTIAYLMQGGIWFWLYAIQEPIIGCLGGLIGSCYRLSKNLKSFKVDFICFEIIFNIFIVLTYVLMLIYTQPNNKGFENMVATDKISEFFNSTYKWILLAILIVFYIVVQAFTIYRFRQDYVAKQYDKLSIFMFAAITCVLVTCIFSFILGPISAVEYFVYLNGRKPSSLLKYGMSYYLLPRVIKESIKTPIYMALYSSLIMLITPLINRVITRAKNTW